MTTDPAQSPSPGSDAALAAGCKCPVLDNAHGAGYCGTGKYIIAEGCPLHLPAQDEVAE